ERPRGVLEELLAAGQLGVRCRESRRLILRDESHPGPVVIQAWIGSGVSLRSLPAHTTVHAVPHTAVPAYCAGGAASCVSCRVSPADRVRTPLPPSRLPASTALAAGSPLPVTSVLIDSETTRDSPLMTGSALRHRHQPGSSYGLC